MNMRILNIFATVILFASCLSNANAKSVEELLRENIDCVNDLDYEVEDNGDTIVYGRASYDVKNGYASSYSGGPPCGCECQSEVALFKDAKGNYTVIKSVYNSCGNVKEVSVIDKDILKVMPEGFCIEWFLGNKNTDFGDFSFQVNFQIPHVGTDMYVYLSVLPLYSYKNDVAGMTFVDSYGYPKSNEDKREVASNLKYLSQFVSEEAMESISMTEFDQIPQKDKDILMSSEKLRYFEELKKGSYVINDIRYFYDICMSIEHVGMLLSWNKKTGRFDLKEKGPKVKKISFKEFIETVSIAGGGC